MSAYDTVYGIGNLVYTIQTGSACYLCVYQRFLARQARLPFELHILLMFLSFFLKMILMMPIISECTGPTFAKFSELVEI